VKCALSRSVSGLAESPRVLRFADVESVDERVDDASDPRRGLDDGQSVEPLTDQLAARGRSADPSASPAAASRSPRDRNRVPTLLKVWWSRSEVFTLSWRVVKSSPLGTLIPDMTIAKVPAPLGAPTLA
jgi:hypothetical protein